MDSDGDEYGVGGEVEVGSAEYPQPAVCDGFDAFDNGVADHPYAVALQFGADDGVEVGVEGGEHGLGHFDDRHLDAAMGEGVGHLRADVPRPDQRGASGASVDDGAHRSCLVDGVQDVHAGKVDARQPGDDRGCAVLITSSS